MKWWNRVGNTQSRPVHNYDGPLFGGHYPGDFSIRKGSPDVNKPLPPPPPQKSVRFGAAPPPWEFYKTAPSWDNTANTRYPAQGSASPQAAQSTPPPQYSSPTTSQESGHFYVVNKARWALRAPHV